MAKIKDPISGFSHAFGAILSIVGLVILVVFASLYGDAYDIVSYTIFGVGLVLLYTFSSLYHLLNLKEKATNVLRKFDHIMIYILIASTYTPICLGVLRGPWGWSIFGVIWGLAVLGTILTSVWLKAPRWLTTGIYLGMGWMVILAIYPMLKTFAVLNALSLLWWLLAGGILYTVGGIIYGLKWPHLKNKYFGFHEIFHIFILLGSACHFIFILSLLSI